MLTALAMAATTLAAFFVTASRVIPFRRLLGYGVALDVSFTLGTAALFYGTLTGLLIATIAGLFMALFITAARALCGYDRASGLYFDGPRPRIIWTRTPARINLTFWRSTLPSQTIVTHNPSSQSQPNKPP